MRQRERGAWRRDTRGVALYILLPVLSFGALLFTLAGTAVQSVRTAHATMVRYVQIALQQTTDAAQTINLQSGAQWTNNQTATQSAATAFTQDLTAELAGTPWAHVPVTLVTFQVLTPQQVGQPAPAGYPNPTVTAPGYYAVITFPCPLPFPGVGPVTIPVTQSIQANTFSAPNTTWNPGS